MVKYALVVVVVVVFPVVIAVVTGFVGVLALHFSLLYGVVDNVSRILTIVGDAGL